MPCLHLEYTPGTNYSYSVGFAFCALLPTWYLVPDVKGVLILTVLAPMLQVNLIREYHFLVSFDALLPTWYQVSKLLYLVVPSKNNDIGIFILLRIVQVTISYF